MKIILSLFIHLLTEKKENIKNWELQKWQVLLNRFSCLSEDQSFIVDLIYIIFMSKTTQF